MGSPGACKVDYMVLPDTDEASAMAKLSGDVAPAPAFYVEKRGGRMASRRYSWTSDPWGYDG